MNFSLPCALRLPQRAHRKPRLGRRPGFDSLEVRDLLAAPTVGGPGVDPADFRITTFASGLNYPYSMQPLSDESLLVATSRPRNPSSPSYWNSIGELVRLVDADRNGVADGPGTVLATGLPGALTSARVAGNLVFTTSSAGGSEQITVLRAGTSPADPLTTVGVLDFTFPSGWWHTTYALAVRPTPGAAGRYDLFFNVGSQFNYDPTTQTVPVSGLISADLNGDSIYRVTVDPGTSVPTLSNLTQIATGLRNAAGIVVDPTTGDLYFTDNGIDGLVDGNEPLSADELNRIAAADIGGAVEDFGSPTNYIEYRTGIERGSGGIDPLFAFQPLPSPNGSESEGPAEIALAPPGFPAGLNQGVFVGFHGKFSQGGLTNEENPLVFANLATGGYFHFIGNNEPDVGHLDGLLSTIDSLFAADIDTTGRMSGTAASGAIYQIQALPARFDFGTASSPVEPGYTRATETSRYTAAAGFGWTTSGTQSRDRGTGGALTRDFAMTEGNRPLGFRLDLANGVYDVTITAGDAAYDRGPESVSLEGVVVDTISAPRGQFVQRTYRVTVADGRLDLELRGTGGATTAYINGLTVTFVASAPPLPSAQRFDFGTASSPVEPGYTRATETSRYTAAAGFGWTTSGTQSRDRGAGGALTRDFAMTEGNLPLGFRLDLANGVYDVTITAGDAAYDRGPESVSLEGVVVDTISAPRGQFVQRTYRVTVADGRLDLELRGTSGATTAYINGLDVNFVTATAAAPAGATVALGGTSEAYPGASSADGTSSPVSLKAIDEALSGWPAQPLPSGDAAVAWFLARRRGRGVRPPR